MLEEKIELGLDLPPAAGPFFKLDDPVRGVLDNTEYVLSGVIFYDVTSRVQRYSIRRGKSRQLENFNAGIASVVFGNLDRAFDPTYTASPYYGQVIPKREIRITTNGQRRYTGLIDDWNLDYSVSTESTASITASDGFAKLANQTLTEGTATPQLPGARINAILDSSDVLWPVGARDIDTGTVLLGADVLPAGGNVLNYLQQVENTELGHFYIDKSGRVTFKDARALLPNSSTVVTLADDGTGIPYAGMQVVYGSELLYNQIVASSVSAAGTAIADALESQETYGIQTYSRNDLLMSEGEDLDKYVLSLARLYKNPEYRFENITINLDTLTSDQVTAVLGLEIGSLCKIVFTPNGVAPAIEKYAEVIAVSDSTDVVRHSVTLGFATLDTVPFVLDDAVFGRLNTGTLG
jgi:hypothetical protein